MPGMKWIVGSVVILDLLFAGEANATIITADVVVHSPNGQWVPLEVGQYRDIQHYRHYWHDVPTFTEEQDFLFWQFERTGFPAIPDGLMTFEVLTNGPVLLACRTPWGGEGSPGEWEEELISLEDFQAEGWSQFATGMRVARDEDRLGAEYIVYRRECTAGEVLTYRTEKYNPPIVIRSASAVPEPASLALWAGLGILGLAVARRRQTARTESRP